MGVKGLCTGQAREGEGRVSEGTIISLLTGVLRSVFQKNGAESCCQKGQSSLLSMLLLKACRTFIWVDKELVIISTEGLDSFSAPHHELTTLNSTCVYAAQT